ncbi:hypothetical protein F503_05774 [Ophiostoma piceae UAMH 11346]|uniref:Uncharacterized protein n=1 Tax=Ophiostoma piceae (strain UAMH 11346) TaxID=1262450 RepID=S3CAZ5_OPHP1|nr:hypothetical protein F503_05774 [Ophiostoma piceae UAMH 11346]
MYDGLDSSDHEERDEERAWADGDSEHDRRATETIGTEEKDDLWTRRGTWHARRDREKEQGWEESIDKKRATQADTKAEFSRDAKIGKTGISKRRWQQDQCRANCNRAGEVEAKAVEAARSTADSTKCWKQETQVQKQPLEQQRLRPCGSQNDGREQWCSKALQRPHEIGPGDCERAREVQ